MPKSLPEQLDLKKGMRARVLECDEWIVKQLKKAGVVYEYSELDGLFFTVKTPNNLTLFGKLKHMLNPDGIVWAFYFKKGKGPKEAPSQSEVRAAALEAGYKEDKLISATPALGAMKFVQ